MFRNLSISAKLFLTFVPIFAFGIGLSVYLTTVSQEEQMQAQALESATQKARIVREALVNMMVESQVVDDRWLERVRTVADLNDLYIRIDTASLRLAEDYMDSSRTVRLWERVQKAQAKDEFDNRYGAEVLTTGKQQWLRIGDNFRAMIPFAAEKKCQRCHDVRIGDVLGVAHIEFPLTAIIKANEENARRTAFISGGIALLVIGAGFVFFRSLVQRPLKRLEKAAEEIGKGEMSAELDLPEGGDEVGRLASSFARMRQALRQSQESMRISTVGQVAASLVQDFRSPIKEIEQILSEVRTTTMENARRDELLVTATEAAHLVNRMTQDLIDYTSGSIRVEKRLSSVGKMLRGVAASVKPDLDRQEIALNVHAAYDASAMIDPERTLRALDNIISYAANYVPAGGAITLRSDAADGRLILTITDNGSGIPSAFREKIFEPFVKVVQGGGVGLDLALAKKIIELQRGNIALTSEEGQGTSYAITLPM